MTSGISDPGYNVRVNSRSSCRTFSATPTSMTLGRNCRHRPAA